MMIYGVFLGKIGYLRFLVVSDIVFLVYRILFLNIDRGSILLILF